MKPFTIPLQSQVRAYMAERKLEWPGSFLDWYADMFWNHYMANGWMQGKGRPLKSWQHAFNVNWKELTPQSREKLSDCLRTEKVITNYDYSQNQKKSKFADVFEDYKKGIINRELMADFYRPLKENGYLKFTHDEVKNLVEWAGNNKQYGRYLAVKLYFKKLIDNEKTFINNI